MKEARSHTPLEQGATCGEAEEQLRLGLRLLSGDGCDVDTARGARWLARAAAGGDARAAAVLTRIHRFVALGSP